MSTTAPRLQQLDLNLLRVLREIYAQRQLNLAAERLALSPSAVSHALRRLRLYFDDPLFSRVGRYLVPSPYCEQLAPAVTEHLMALQQLLTQADSFMPQTANTIFTIGMPDALESSLLPQLHNVVQQQAPGCGLRSVPYQRSELSSLLSMRALDLVVDVALPLASPICHQALMQDSFTVIGRHSLKRGTIAQYLQQRHVAVSGRAEGLVLEDHLLLAAGYQRDITLRCQNYQSAAQIVAQSDLLLTLPKLIGAPLASRYKLSTERLPLDNAELKLRVYWHQQDSDNAANRWLRHNLIQLAATQTVDAM